MHHSQLEYLIAVQKLQREDRGAKGYEVAGYLNVSPAYTVKLDGKVSVFLRSGRRRCKRRRRKMRMRAYGLDAAGARQSAYRAKRINKIFFANRFAYGNLWVRKAERPWPFP